MNYLNLAIIASGLVITTGLGDYFSKLFVTSPSPAYGLGLAVSYNVSLVFWILLLNSTKHLASAGLIWGVSATAVLIMISQLVFQEPMTLKQWLGVGLGFVSLLLLL